MRVQDIIRAPKSNVLVGDWSAGKMPRAKFPLSRAGKRAYNIGSAWRWRFVEFEALGLRFVVRVLYSEAKQRVFSHLAIRGDRDCTVLSSLEYHPDLNTGWHLHSICGSVKDAPSGTLVHGRWVKRMPGARQPHRRTEFLSEFEGGAEAWLWRQTLRFYGVDRRKEQLL